MDNGETVQLKTSSLHPPCALEEMQQLPGIWSRFYCPTFRGNDQKQVAKVYDQRNSDWQLITQNQTTLLEDFEVISSPCLFSHLSFLHLATI